MPVVPDNLFQATPKQAPQSDDQQGAEDPQDPHKSKDPETANSMAWIDSVRMTRDAKDLLRSLVFLTQCPKYIGAADRVKTCASDPSDTTS
jgi:hypothetical protein